MHALIAVVVAGGLVAGTPVPTPPPPSDPVACNPLRPNTCSVTVTSAGQPAASPRPRKPAAPAVNACIDQSQLVGPTNGLVPCNSRDGWWSNALQCYVQPLNPQPATTDPLWQGQTTGALYMCTTPYVPSTRVVWLAVPPAGLPVAPGQLALRALSLVKVPRPVVQRSPVVDNADNGVPYTWVNVWTWWWTTPQTWTVQSATARAGAVWATVTVTPSRMVITPGDGGTAMTCTGPGRPWTPADGDHPPSAGGCGYVYRHVTTAGPLTATLAVTWTVTWIGSAGATGALPALTTTTASRFAVEQVQVVNT